MLGSTTPFETFQYHYIPRKLANVTGMKMQRIVVPHYVVIDSPWEDLENSRQSLVRLEIALTTKKGYVGSVTLHIG